MFQATPYVTRMIGPESYGFKWNHFALAAKSQQRSNSPLYRGEFGLRDKRIRIRQNSPLYRSKISPLRRNPPLVMTLAKDSTLEQQSQVQNEERVLNVQIERIRATPACDVVSRNTTSHKAHLQLTEDDVVLKKAQSELH
ncbi:hypothetical protein Salat_2410900 [Sesamum alatum]|uniref:Uncharacterized protein n=1 Tax=Sesamum alatum TaxID=300844 RepID=A0AAE1XXS1_9LAMI|nr:hypothetical protein Salat_2410900 [Sesamum alatum]